MGRSTQRAGALERRWEGHLAELRAYRKRFGNCDVPIEWKENHSLAVWVFTQRTNHRRGKLSPERRRKLEALGFTFSYLGDKWEQKFEQLQAFEKRFGHCLVPMEWPEGPELGIWVQRQRHLQREGKLKRDRWRRLGRLGFTWDVQEDIWAQRIAELAKLRARHGRIQLSRTDPETKDLAWWVNLQRWKAAEGTLTTEQQAELAALGLDFEPADLDWEEGFEKLRAFQKAHGHCDVPATGADRPLWSWLVVQHRNVVRKRLSPERLQSLASLGWEPKLWVNPAREETWEAMFGQLKVFVDQHGHDLVPAQGATAELHRWMQGQRTAHLLKQSLRADRVERLNALGFSWHSRERRWEEQFAALVAYTQEHGHCRGPWRLGYPKLSSWISTQRLRKAEGTLRAGYAARLEALGLPWSGKVGDPEDTPLRRMVEYRREKGHCWVWVSEDRNLYFWALKQRELFRKGTLAPAVLRELTEIGFPLTREETEWEQRFAHLKSSYDRWKVCRVSPGTELERWLVRQQRLAQEDQLEPDRSERLAALGVAVALAARVGA